MAVRILGWTVLVGSFFALFETEAGSLPNWIAIGVLGLSSLLVTGNALAFFAGTLLLAGQQVDFHSSDPFHALYMPLYVIVAVIAMAVDFLLIATNASRGRALPWRGAGRGRSGGFGGGIGGWGDSGGGDGGGGGGL